jgi:excinuclease ABC subunit A
LDLIDKVIAIDQSPIGRNPRSNPGTYIKLFDEIRNLFCLLPESQARGYKPGRFSFNVKDGSCTHCEGMGLVKIDMDFMEDAWVDCPVCKTKRFDEETLSIFYKGKNIHDILEMEVAEALEFFTNIPSIRHKLETLQKVGMEYIKLGQSSTTLSGGEAQRIKLAKELVRPSTGNTVYIFDEPTTGLHFHDIKHLLQVLHELVERGNTVIVIEHNMDVVKTADWIVDIGPEAGQGGGEVVATGTPEKIAALDSPTAHALQHALKNQPAENVARLMKGRAARKKRKQEKTAEEVRDITVLGAEQNNLKHLDVSIPRDKLTIFTGPSGSGKTSLAFETIYAEGQRRYIESLSPYARQFVKQMPKPKIGHIEGLSPAIAIEQKSHAGNPRSTVGTMTEIYDYLRVLYARVGIPHSPETGKVIQSISKESVADRILSLPENEKIQILTPIEIKKNEKFEDLMQRLQRLGFLRIRLNGDFFDLDQENLISHFDRKRKNELLLVIDRLKVHASSRQRLLEAIENATKISEGKLIVAQDNKDTLFNLAFSDESTGKAYPEITPHTFAFNHASGMCLDCLGLGYQYGANLTQNPTIMNQSASSLLRLLWQEKFSAQAFKLFENVLKTEGISLHLPLNGLPPDQLQLIMNGSPAEKWYPTTNGFSVRWYGINTTLAKIGKSAHSEIRDPIIPILDELECLSCGGSRLNPLAQHVTINDLSISDLCRLPIKNACTFIDTLHLSAADSKLLDEVKKQLTNKLRFLCEVGLDYLSLERRAPTLSGGEAQRIRLARQLGSGLTGVLYVLDEPTIGLHPRDSDRLNNALQQLKDLGNTLLMVEHDPLSIERADYLLDFGPQAGEHGGHITAKGTLKEIKKNPNSLTGAYLTGKKFIPTPEKRRQPGKEMISIANASIHNLKNITVQIPLKLLTCLTGVSGSGKSSLLSDILLPACQKGLLSANRDAILFKGCQISGLSHIDKVISIDQNPIGLTARSDVGTYVDILPKMRDFFAQLPQARMKGLQGKHFSYNHRRGMCTSCWGMGYRKVEMHFMPPIRVECEECKGLRLNPVSLEIQYADKNFGEYLQLTVDEARLAFANHPRIIRPLDTLISVGLGYLKLGQEMASLSGGEAQRIKLSRELTKRSTGKTLYLLDEPTTGLHPDDIKKLLTVLQRLVDKGNTMVIIEHNLDVIKNADHVIELGPEAGENGGYVVFTGTPEALAKDKQAWTAKYL